jgi:hypothetical protein
MFWLCRNTHRRAEAAPGAVTLLAKASILVPRPFATCIRWGIGEDGSEGEDETACREQARAVEVAH